MHSCNQDSRYYAPKGEFAADLCICDQGTGGDQLGYSLLSEHEKAHDVYIGLRCSCRQIIRNSWMS